MDTVNIDFLSREEMFEIFKVLNFSDLKRVVLVSYWRDLGEDPSLWRRFCLDLVKVFFDYFSYQGQFGCNSEEFVKLMNIPRLSMIKHFVIEVGKLTEKIFLLNLNSNLSSLQIGYNTRLTSISPTTIVSVLNVLEKVILKTKLSKQQLTEFSSEMKTTTCLETLELYYNNLSTTESQIVSEPLPKELTLCFVKPSTLQVEEIP